MLSLIYKLMFLPVLIGVAFLASLFSKKIRRGLWPRRKSVQRVREFTANLKPLRQVVLVHAASMGEYEHIRPVLEKLKQEFDTINVVSFFSPSGYENVKTNAALDFTFYTPLDFSWNWNKIYSTLKPAMVIISKHDVWAGMVWQARKKQIPIYLVNASLAENSSRLRPLVRQFMGHVYRHFDKIYTISDEDKNRFQTFFKLRNVALTGDTKYDQVLLRKQAALKEDVLNVTWKNAKKVFLAGSIWPEDEAHLIPALKSRMEDDTEIKSILVPHQPTGKAIQRLEKEFQKFDCIKLSNQKVTDAARVLIVDSVGHLAGLYKYATVAYVGGSFHQGIHNAMEPAIYGIPVMYGPVHRNSTEAIVFAGENGGIVVRDSREIEEWLTRLLTDKKEAHKYGAKALAFSSKNTGATARLIESWRSVLIENN